MVTLYGPAQAPFTEKVRRALIFKGIDFQLREPRSPEDYKRWSPKTGQLPVLDVSGEHIPDSTVILYRIDELYPDPPLLSGDPKVSAAQRQLEDWADESFLWYFMKYRRMVDRDPLPLVGDGLQGEGGAAGGAGPRAVRSGPARRLFAWLRAGGTWERPITSLQRELGDRMGDLVNFLGSRPFFYAEQLSMADLAVYSMLYTMRSDSIPGASLLLSRRPSLVEFMSRVEAATGG